MKAGENIILTCEDCNQEFQVVLEPKAVNLPENERPKDFAKVEYCPFCGSVNLEGDEVDLGEDED